MFTEKEMKRFEKGRRDYEETINRMAALCEKEKKFLEMVRSVDTGNYRLSSKDMMLIANVFGNNAINCWYMFFNLGFMKGQRSEKTKQKIERKTVI